MGNRLEHAFQKKGSMAKKLLKRCSISLIIKEIQIKIIMRFIFSVPQKLRSRKTPGIGEEQ